MYYQIIITRQEKNPDYAQQLKEWNERNMYRGNSINDLGPSPKIIENALTCTLTEEQFKKIKAECFKAFE